MVKVRLWGTADEVKALADYLEANPLVKVYQRSEPYSDRGKSVYQRVYLDIAYEAKEEKIEVRGNDSPQGR